MNHLRCALAARQARSDVPLQEHGGILTAMLAAPPPLCSRRTLAAEALAVPARGCGCLLPGVLAAPTALPGEIITRRDAVVPGRAR